MAEFHVLFYPFEYRVMFYEGNAVLISSKNAFAEAAFFDNITAHDKTFGNCWSIVGSCTTSLIKNGNSILIVDPGSPQIGGSGALKARLAQLKLRVEDVSCVVNTHLHSDHVGSNFIFRGKPLLIHKNEIKSRNLTEIMRAYIAPMEVREIKGNTQVTDDVSIIETPGHTPGSVTVMANTPQGLVAIAGDTIMAKEHFLERRLPEWEPNKEQIFKMMDRIESFKPKIIVPGHDSPFNL